MVSALKMIEKTRLREDKPISGFRESWFNSLSIGPRDARGDIGNVFANVFLGRPFPGQGPLLLSRYPIPPIHCSARNIGSVS